MATQSQDQAAERHPLSMQQSLCCPAQDLNAQPLLLEQVDASYNAVLCVNGLQYLTQPEAVLTEVRTQQRAAGKNSSINSNAHTFAQQLGLCHRAIQLQQSHGVGKTLTW
jgi:hypothetical protein